MAGFGQVSLETFGTSLEVSADGRPEMKAGGVTIDWSTVAAVAGSDVTQPDGVTVHVGEKYLRYGQVVCMIGVAEVETVTLTGGPTGGTFTLTLPASGAEPAQSTTALPFNETAANVQAALAALPRLGASGVTVTRTGTGTAGDPYIYTVTFGRNLGDVPQLTAANTFTGGTTPTVTVATTTPGNAAGGKYGPYDPAATDGRQTLARGACFILNKTMRELWERSSDHPPVLYGGLVFRGRLLATAGTHSLAAGPTFAELEAAFPRLAYVGESPG
jgi:hypothetical protein